MYFCSAEVVEALASRGNRCLAEKLLFGARSAEHALAIAKPLHF